MADDIYEETTDLRFLYQCIDQHNEYRRSKNLPLLEYNRQLEIQARKRATKMALADMFLPSEARKSTFTENAARTAANSAISCRPLVNLWYTDAKDKVPAALFSRTLTMKTTEEQKNIVWKTSTQLGCAQVVKVSPPSAVYTVCNYGRGHDIDLDKKTNMRQLSMMKKVAVRV
ncbi:hypothetical protein HDE_04424 [Halotydeus destructor]|nr:hypothetical protein HDE_04424 [Halotydeus destructor]